MALQKNLIHPAPYDETVDAYFMISGITWNRIEGQAVVLVSAYKSASARSAFKAAQAGIETARGSLATASGNLAVAKTDAEKAAAHSELETAKAALSAQAAGLEANKAFPNIGQFVIEADAIDAVTDPDGGYDIAKTYAHLKTLPEFSGALDV